MSTAVLPFGYAVFCCRPMLDVQMFLSFSTYFRTLSQIYHLSLWPPHVPHREPSPAQTLLQPRQAQSDTANHCIWDVTQSLIQGYYITLVYTPLRAPWWNVKKIHTFMQRFLYEIGVCTSATEECTLVNTGNCY